MANKLNTYLKDSVTELKKVTWPTRKETVNYTILVISVSLAIAFFLGALDFVFSEVLKLVINRGA